MNLRVQAENGCGLILPFVFAFFIYEWHLLIASVLFRERLLKKEKVHGPERKHKFSKT